MKVYPLDIEWCIKHRAKIEFYACDQGDRVAVFLPGRIWKDRATLHEAITALKPYTDLIEGSQERDIYEALIVLKERIKDSFNEDSLAYMAITEAMKMLEDAIK